MPTTSKAIIPSIQDSICQGDIFQFVRYNYIDDENDVDVQVIEFEFPLAVVISQACDTIAMSEVVENRSGKPTKFMPSILMCPIYDEAICKTGKHLSDAFDTLNFEMKLDDPLFQKDDLKVSKRNWHYRFHSLSVEVNQKIILDNCLMDFKNYFTVPMSYLCKNKNNRILRLEDLFAEQITLKFATYLARVAIP